MKQTDKEVLDLCKEWFEEIADKANRLTSGNVTHNSKFIRGLALNCAEYIKSHIKEG
ncbi:MAG: hypothetical protein IJ640_10525 [Prevotella sp.]|nr:hypothetical protein [Prevotella sp.]